jgi:hypothetical protein
VYRSSGSHADTAGLIAFAPVAWLVCSLAQYENQFFGMMVCHYIAALGVVLSLWLLARGGWISLFLAIVAAVTGAWSIVAGFLAFPVGLLVLAARRAGWARAFVWGLAGAAAIARYYRDYIIPPTRSRFSGR